MIKIGVLALQGAVREHIRHIELSGYEGIAIKRVEQLDEIDGLISVSYTHLTLPTKRIV